MKTYDFTLNFSLANTEQDPADLVESLYGGGCSDALLGIGRPGQLSLMLARASDGAQKAIFSAIEDVLDVIPDARLHSVEPDLVGLSDVASQLGFSRQYMRKLMDQHPDFPLPFHQGNPSLWHLADLLIWLKRTKRLDVPGGLVEVARITQQLNAIIQERRVDAEFRQQAGMASAFGS